MKKPTDIAISFDDWAAASAILNTGIDQDKLLHILGVELPCIGTKHCHTIVI